MSSDNSSTLPVSFSPRAINPALPTSQPSEAWIAQLMDGIPFVYFKEDFLRKIMSIGGSSLYEMSFYYNHFH